MSTFGLGFNVSTPFHGTVGGTPYLNTTLNASHFNGTYDEKNEDDAADAVVLATALSANGSAGNGSANGALNITAPLFTTSLVVDDDGSDGGQ